MCASAVLLYVQQLPHTSADSVAPAKDDMSRYIVKYHDDHGSGDLCYVIAQPAQSAESDYEILGNERREARTDEAHEFAEFCTDGRCHAVEHETTVGEERKNNGNEPRYGIAYQNIRQVEPGKVVYSKVYDCGQSADDHIRYEASVARPQVSQILIHLDQSPFCRLFGGEKVVNFKNHAGHFLQCDMVF